eukprot:COSAG06_NODE_55454_length_289_cov_1.089474_1_plen_24_part_10
MDATVCHDGEANGTDETGALGCLR